MREKYIVSHTRNFPKKHVVSGNSADSVRWEDKKANSRQDLA